MPVAAVMESSLDRLFPQRLKKKGPFWTIARVDQKCFWCGDEIYIDEKIAVDPDQKIVWCLQCGTDVIGKLPENRS
jgi:hypothetical protein